MSRHGAVALRVEAHAKVNLSLRILGLRPDGYHQLESLMVPVSLADSVEMKLDPESDGLRLRCPGCEQLERPDNLAQRAAELFRSTIRPWSGALEVTIRKRIPVASGLAGGTADAAAVLRGLCHLVDVDPRSEDVRSLCRSLGSDLVFCFEGCAAWVRGRGEHVVPISHLPGLDLCLVCPDLEVSTGWAYGQCVAPSLDWEQVAELERRPLPEVGSDVEAVGSVVCNDLWAVVSNRHAFLEKLGLELIRLGCVAWGMSGSGPALFGLFRSAGPAAAAAASFRRLGYRACVSRSPAGPGGEPAERGGAAC